MGSKSEREVIGSKFIEDWEYSKYPVQTPNESFIPPDGAPWARLTVVTGDAERTEINGQNRYTRTIGLVIISVFTPSGSGDALARELCDTAASIFRGAELLMDNGSVRFREPAIKHIGIADDEAYYQMNTVVPYFRDELFAEST